MRPRGFSLIELLVCMTVIVVLVTLALPSLRASRGEAARAACLSNLHGVGQAFAGYIGAHDALPRASRIMHVTLRVELALALEPYLDAPTPGARFARPWVCPADPGRGRVEASYRYSAADLMNGPLWFDPYRVPVAPNIGRVALLWYESEPRAELLLDMDRWHTRRPQVGSWHGSNILYLDGSARGH